MNSNKIWDTDIQKAVKKYDGMCVSKPSSTSFYKKNKANYTLQDNTRTKTNACLH